MRKDFYEQLDRLYFSQPKSIEAFLQETLTQCRQEQDSEGIVAVFNELGGFFRGRARYEDSLLCFQEALKQMKGLGLTESVPYLTALMNRAGTLRLVGRAEESVSDFRRVLALLKGETGKIPYIRAATLNNLWLAYQDLARLDQAEDCARQALTILQAMPGMEAEIASSGNNLASLSLRQDRLEDADHWLTEAMAYYQSPAGEHDPHLANAYTTLASLRFRQGRLEDALACYTKAAAATEHFFGKNENYASLLYDTALVAHALGRADATAYLSQAVAIYETLQESADPMRNQAQQLLAEWREDL